MKQKILSLPRNLSYATFGELLIVFSSKVNLLHLLFLMALRCCYLHMIKQNYLLKTFLRTLILTAQVSLYLLSTLELHKIPVTPTLVKNVITNLDSTKASGPECISVVALKDCEPELLSALADLFNMCFPIFFPDCWKVSSVVTVFKNVGEKSTAKKYCLVSLLSMIIKIFQKLVNNRLVNHLKKCNFFLIANLVSGFLNQLQIL